MHSCMYVYVHARVFAWCVFTENGKWEIVLSATVRSETITTLIIGYTPIQNKMFDKKQGSIRNEKENSKDALKVK